MSIVVAFSSVNVPSRNAFHKKKLINLYENGVMLPWNRTSLLSFVRMRPLLYLASFFSLPNSKTSVCIFQWDALCSVYFSMDYPLAFTRSYLIIPSESSKIKVIHRHIHCFLHIPIGIYTLSNAIHCFLHLDPLKNTHRPQKTHWILHIHPLFFTH